MRGASGDGAASTPCEGGSVGALFASSVIAGGSLCTSFGATAGALSTRFADEGKGSRSACVATAGSDWAGGATV
jgi:hypothetical protein